MLGGMPGGGGPPKPAPPPPPLPPGPGGPPKGGPPVSATDHRRRFAQSCHELARSNACTLIRSHVCALSCICHAQAQRRRAGTPADEWVAETEASCTRSTRVAHEGGAQEACRAGGYQCCTKRRQQQQATGERRRDREGQEGDHPSEARAYWASSLDRRLRRVRDRVLRPLRGPLPSARHQSRLARGMRRKTYTPSSIDPPRIDLSVSHHAP